MPVNPGPSIAIIGAGPAGISAAITFQRRFGAVNITIYEKASGLGGTWRDNTYPGCSSDTAVHLYSLSTDPNFNCDSTNISQAEIYAYIQGLADKYGLKASMRLNCNVISADWDSERELYHLTSEDLPSGVCSTSTAHIIISAIGILSTPRMPDIPGLNEFSGTMVHSASWDNKIDLRGKRVLVIGNGPTATQLIPQILKIEGIKVTQFFRTPNWYLPTMSLKVSHHARSLFTQIPLLKRIFRCLIYLFYELFYAVVFGTSFFRPYVTSYSRDYILGVAPQRYHKILIPEYPLGCRRIVYDTEYLAALHKPNITISNEEIVSVNCSTFVTKTGEHLDFDVVVAATGFVVDHFPFVLRGVDQTTLQEYYDSHGGPQAYLGTTIPGFPNFFILGGPNTTTGYMSYFFFIECQLNYILNLVDPIFQRKISSVEVKDNVVVSYNSKIQRRISSSVWVSCASSWYRIGGTGRNVTIFPGPSMLFWWWTRSLDWADYKATGRGVNPKIQIQSQNRFITRLLIASSVLVVWRYFF